MDAMLKVKAPRTNAKALHEENEAREERAKAAKGDDNLMSDGT